MRLHTPSSDGADVLDGLARRTAQLYDEARRAVDSRRSQRRSPAGRDAASAIERLENEIAALKAELRASEQRAAAAEARADVAERRLRDGHAPYTEHYATHDAASRICCSAAHLDGEVRVQGESSQAAANTLSASPCHATTCSPVRSACPDQAATSVVSAAHPQSCCPSRPGSGVSDDMVPPPSPRWSEPHPHATAVDSGTEAQRAIQTQLHEQCQLISLWHQQMRDSVIALQVESSTWRRQQAQHLAERHEWEAEQAARCAENAAAEDTQLRRAHSRAKAILRGVEGGEALGAAWSGACRQTHVSPPSPSGSSSAAGTPVAQSHRTRRGYAAQLAAGREVVASLRHERIKAMLDDGQASPPEQKKGAEEERLSGSTPARDEPQGYCWASECFL